MKSKNYLSGQILKAITASAPCAAAYIGGSVKYDELHGIVRFWDYKNGSVVMADVSGLPDTGGGICDHPIFALHIHAGTDCSGTPAFADADGHFNPQGCLHPYHAGDLPPLFSDGGRAWLAVYTDRFRPRDVIGRTVIIHIGPDDFHTQPSGAAGEMIACGLIEKNRDR